MKLVGKYRLESVLGEGAFGVVYKGVHKDSNQIVAVKAIKLASLNKKLLKQLETELNVMKIIDSPYVVHLIDVLKTSNCVYIVMEYCDGGDLEVFKSKYSKAPEPVAKRWLMNLLEAFTTLHAHNVLHRDLKLANILLSEKKMESAVAKVADFGFARFATETSLAETQLGTPMFMAPEILAKTPYNYKVDVWSLGVLAYEMMVGQQAFIVYTLEELVAAQKKPIFFPEEAGLTDEAKSLIEMMMKYRPSDRPTFDDVKRHPFFQEPVPQQIREMPETQVNPLHVSEHLTSKNELPVEGIPTFPAQAIENRQKEELTEAKPGEEEKDHLIDEYEVFDDRPEEETQVLVKTFSLVEDSQFIATPKLPPTTQESAPVPEPQPGTLQNPVPIEEEKIDFAIHPSSPPKSISPSSKDVFRNEILSLDYQTFSVFEPLRDLAEKYISAGKPLIAFGVYFACREQVMKTIGKFKTLCQMHGIEENPGDEIGQIYEKLRKQEIESNACVNHVQTQLTEKDLSRSVLMYEDTGLRIENRLFLEEATRLHSLLPSFDLQTQLSTLKEALLLLTIADSDGEEGGAAKMMMTKYVESYKSLLGGSFMT